MGAEKSITYAVPVTQKLPGESAIYRYPDFRDKLFDRFEDNLRTMKDVLINSATKFANSPCLGTIVTRDNKSEIEYITYRETLQQAHAIGSAIHSEKLFNQPEGEKLKLFGIFSKNRAEWAIADIAACLFGFTTIPIYDTLGDENITYVFKHAQLTTCFVNDSGIKALLKCRDLVHINRLICFDPFSEEEEKKFRERGVKLIPYAQLKIAGKENLVDYKREEFKVLPDDCLTFSYTSGTTGPPKGAMISHKNFVSFIASERLHKDTHFCESDIALSYLPLPHILERQFDFDLLSVGARIVYYSGDVQKIKDDLALVQPTIFVSVPRLYSRFYDIIKAKFNDLTGVQKALADRAVNIKMEKLTKTGQYTDCIYDQLIFKKTKQALGGNCRLMISGSAPLLPQVQNFLKICMCAPLVQGYGQTESTGAMFITVADDPEVRHVGGPTANIEVKLVDIPEMNYLSTDVDQNGFSTPRGEIWARGPGVFLGYYHDEEKTKETVTADGWLKTGDVGAMSAKTKAMSIVDRKKNIFKLQQGEYVAAEKVENTYMKGNKLAEIFIHGDSTETFVIAIAVPHRKFVEEFAANLKIEGNYEDLCRNQAIRGEFIQYLAKIGKEGGLQGFEQAKNIYLETEPFVNRGILTNTMKIQRHEAKKFYRPQIDKLYKEGMLKVDKK